MKDLSYWVALNDVVLPKNYFKLFGKIRLEKDKLDQAARDIKWCSDHGIEIIRLIDKSYPPLLKEIPDPPPLLYVEGHLHSGSLAIGIVGTRRASTYGLQVTETMAGELARRAVTVISGGAFGIDQKAHESALSNSGKTIAVLGSGLATLYPKQHESLFKRISKQGALVSEFSPFSLPHPYHFPRRNRIISGLSKGVIVVEAPQKSGALITADFALEQGRDVFAVPAQIFSKQSRGCHELIRQGAKPLFSIQDILDEYPILNNSLTLQQGIVHSLSLMEKNILEHLNRPSHFSELAQHFPLDDLSNALLSLEMQGWVAQRFNQYYRRRLCQKL